MRTLVTQSNDLIGVLLIILINDLTKKSYGETKFDAIDFYFDQINIIVWPRFERLFEVQLQSIKGMNPKKS